MSEDNSYHQTTLVSDFATKHQFPHDSSHLRMDIRKRTLVCMIVLSCVQILTANSFSARTLNAELARESLLGDPKNADGPSYGTRRAHNAGHERTIRLSSNQLLQRVIQKSPIERPSMLGKNQTRGVVAIQILIDKQGRVVYARGVEGDPFAIASSTKSLRNWRFTPYVRKGRQRSVTGVVSLPFDFRTDASSLNSTAEDAFEARFGPEKMFHPPDVDLVRFSPDGTRIVSASFYGTVIMWDARSGRQVWRADLDEDSKTKEGYTISEILGLALSPDGDVVAVSYSRGSVVGQSLQPKREERIGLLDSKTGREVKVLTGHVDQIGRLDFSPYGGLLLSEGGDSTARLWNIRTGQQVLVVKLKEKGAAVAFSPDGKVFAVATQPLFGVPPQPIVGLYEAKTGRLVREFARTTNATAALAFSPDGNALAMVGGDASGSEINIWSLNGQNPETTLSMPGQTIKAISFSSDGRYLAVGGHVNEHGIVEMRDLELSSKPRTYRFDGSVTALSFSPVGKQLVVGTDKGDLVLLSTHANR
jgi:WD40 repeat protein